MQTKELKTAAARRCPAYLLYSFDRPSLEAAAESLLAALETGEGVTVFEGPGLPLEELTAAVGTISFLPGERLVYLPLAKPGSWGAKDLKAFCELLGEIVGAILVVTVLTKEKKARPDPGKAEQKVFAAAEKAGFCTAVLPAGPKELAALAAEQAAALGTQFGPGAAEALAQRCGGDPVLLVNETAKLAAASGYGSISAELVAQLSRPHLEADVFELAGLCRRGQGAQALAKARVLLANGEGAVAIAAALAAQFTDLYRLKVAAAAGKGPDAVHADFHYKGSPFRLRYAARDAALCSAAQLLAALGILEELDDTLKGGMALEEDTAFALALTELAAVFSAKRGR